MPRITVAVSEDAAEWLDSEKERTGKSKAKLGGECIELMHSEVHHIEEARSDVMQSASPTPAAVDDLRERVEELEAALEQPTAAETPNPSPEIRTSPGVEGGETRLQDAMLDGSLGERVAAAVEAVAEGWTDSEARLAARTTAAHAVLTHAVESGEAVGKSDAINQFYAEHQVDGQTEETWYRKNIRPVLKEYGEYSQGAHGYVVDEDALPSA